MIETLRRLFGRRWAVVLVFPPLEQLGEIRSPLHSRLTYSQAVNRLPADEHDPLVVAAIRSEHAYLEVRRLDRFGLPIL